MHFANAQFILNQYQRIEGKPLEDEALKRVIEQSLDLIKGGLYQEALPLLKKIAKQVKVPAVYNNLGGLFAITKSYDHACEAYSKAIAEDAEYQPVHMNFGLLE